MSAQQAASHKEINMHYYFVSLRDVPPAQDPLPMPLEVFYVATNVVQDGKEYNGVKVSPAFRTSDEAYAFLDTCGIDGAYCLRTELILRNDAERDEYALKIFGAQKGGAA